MNDKIDKLLIYIEARHTPEKIMFIRRGKFIHAQKNDGNTNFGGLDPLKKIYSIEHFLERYKEEISQHPEHYKTMMSYLSGETNDE